MIRQWLARILGLRMYLVVVSRVFIVMMLAGFFRKKFPEYHFLKSYIRPGWYCMDIGANLGYFSVLMSRKAGKTGHVHAIEPVKMFNRIFSGNLAIFGKRNVTLHSFALGAQQGTVQMGTPVRDGIFRHGLTRVLDDKNETFAHTYEVAVEIPDSAFSTLSRLDFIKCDVEGYETEVFPSFLQTLQKFRPVIQTEINTADNRRQIRDLLRPMGYQPYGLRGNKLLPLDNRALMEWQESDLYFVTKD